MANVCAVIGGALGSEGKGAYVAAIANKYNVHVRTGGPNAGHTFYHLGRAWVMQSLPCGWMNPNAKLVIGAGATVDPKNLIAEIEMVSEADPTVKSRVFVDPKASVLLSEHYADEGGVSGDGHLKIGSTGKGVGACRASHMDRGIHGLPHALAGDYEDLKPYLADTAELLDQWYKAGENILLEGTQGSGLSLIHGPWPFVTSADTNSGQLATDAGVPPNRVNERIIVARTMPIRVAGNSGPLKGETTWEELSARLGKEVLEKTTVTKKIRRIGVWDDVLFHRTCLLNDPTGVAITFLDYVNSADYGKTKFEDLSAESIAFLTHVAVTHGVKIVGATTGPLAEHYIDLTGVELVGKIQFAG